MRTFHMISAKRMGWEQMYDYYPFPTDKYSKDDVIAQFRPITKETLKNNHWCTYTAYEFQGEVYYEIVYSGVYDEGHLLNRGFTKEDLDSI